MIKTEVLYEESELSHHLAGAFTRLAEARKDGKVKHLHVNYSTFYLGSDVIDWLKSASESPVAVAKPQKAADSPSAPVKP